jgi:hypothetical protein
MHVPPVPSEICATSYSCHNLLLVLLQYGLTQALAWLYFCLVIVTQHSGVSSRDGRGSKTAHSFSPNGSQLTKQTTIALLSA